MKYKIVLEKRAEKFIRKQTPNNQRRLIRAINELPYAGDIKSMG